VAVRVFGSSKGGARYGKDLIVTPPAGTPIGARMVLFISVRARSDRSSDHTITTPDGWTKLAAASLSNYVVTTSESDYKQLWAYIASYNGEESWIFESHLQNPTRAYRLIAVTGNSSGGNSYGDNSATNTVTHTLPAATSSSAVGDMLIYGTTDRFDTEMSGVVPSLSGLTFHSRTTTAATTGRSNEADLSVFIRHTTTAGTVAQVSYTVATSPYCSGARNIPVETDYVLTGEGLGEFNVPNRAGVPLVEHALGFRSNDALADALAHESNRPILLATLNPLRSDAVNAVTEQLKFSSGFYDEHHLPAIQKWPELKWSMYSGGIVGGEVGDTAGTLELNNDRTTVGDDS